MADADNTPGFEIFAVNTAEGPRGIRVASAGVQLGPMRLRVELMLGGEVNISDGVFDKTLRARIAIAMRHAVLQDLADRWARLNEYDRTHHAKLPAVDFTSPHPADLQQEVADLHSIVRLLNERLAKLEREK